MNDTIKAAMIIAGAIVIAVFLYSYFSPYQSCVRAMKADGVDDSYAAYTCGKK